MIEALRISAIGIFIVFFALVIISLCIAMVGKLFTKKSRPKNANVENEGVGSINVDGITPEILAVITAAVNSAYDCSIKIKSIGVLHRESNYGIQGRMKIMSSHKIK